VYVYQVGSESYYWLSTWRSDEDSDFSNPKPGPQVFAMYISWGDLNMQSYSDRNQGTPVRFVKAAPGGATGIESVQSSAVRSQKVLRNGQLLILRDGKTFNATGAEVR
jgi:hypothetical protein